MSTLDVFDALNAKRRLLVAMVVIAGCVGYAGSYLISPRFRSETKAVIVHDQGGGALNRLGSMAGAFGLNVGSGANRLELNAEYVLSHDLLIELVQETWELEDGSTPSLLEAWGKGDSPSERLASAVERFRKYLQVSVKESAGVLALTVETFDPELSALIARRMVAELNDFNAELRKWSGTNRSATLEARLREVSRELRASEDSLLAFRVQNIDLSHPRLQIVEMRLMRRVTVLSEVLQTIRVQQEMAQLEAVSAEPVMKVLQTAQPPLRRSWPRRERIALLAAFATLVLCAYGIVAREAFRRRTDP